MREPRDVNPTAFTIFFNDLNTIVDPVFETVYSNINTLLKGVNMNKQ